MPVVESVIQAELELLYADAAAAASGTPMTDSQFAARMAAIIKNAIVSGTVGAGIAVQVNPATGTGATTGTGSIT